MTKISFLHSGLPNCVSPMVSDIEGISESIGVHGTGFFARRYESLVFVTALHCIGSQRPEDLSRHASRLLIPYELTGIKRSGADYVAFSSMNTFRDSTGEVSDVAVLKIEVKPGSWQEKHLKSRAAKFPPSGRWLDDFCKLPMVELALSGERPIPLVAIGYPLCNTETKIISGRDIVSQSVKVYGTLRRGFSSDLLSMSDMTWAHDMNGFSGSPVFVSYNTKHGCQYALAGMIVRGGNQRAQFIRISQFAEPKLE